MLRNMKIDMKINEILKSILLGSMKSKRIFQNIIKYQKNKCKELLFFVLISKRDNILQICALIKISNLKDMSLMKKMKITVI